MVGQCSISHNGRSWYTHWLVGHLRTWSVGKHETWPKSRRFAAIPSINLQKISMATYFRAVGKHETWPESRGFAAIPQLDTFNFKVSRAFSDETFRPFLDQWFWTHGHFFCCFHSLSLENNNNFHWCFSGKCSINYVSLCPCVQP